jgi:phage recombination protein Bet
MANAPAPIGIAPRYQKPAIFGGTDVSWRVLCDLYPAAETPEIIMAVVEYCAARKLDPLRKPVHIVPMYNSKLRRRVQVVMQGINEHETTAHRTGKWAGMDLPQWGPDETRTFRGQVENDDGSKRDVEVTLTFPVWCAVTVYRRVDGVREAFAEPVYWIEAYAKAGFRTEVPNARWTQAPRQMLHKCAKSASLRAAFPEEGFGPTADEMEDRETDTGGVTIDGHVDHGDPGLTTRDRRIEQKPPPQPPGDPGQGLDEPNGSKWLKNLLALIAGAKTRPEVFDLRDDPRVEKVLAEKKTPSLIKGQIEDAFTAAFKRIEAAEADAAEAAIEDPGPPEDDAGKWRDRMAELIAEVEAMDLVALDGLKTSAAWRKRVRDATEIPPDEDRLNEAIAARRAALQGGRERGKDGR